MEEGHERMEDPGKCAEVRCSAEDKPARVGHGWVGNGRGAAQRLPSSLGSVTQPGLTRRARRG